MIDLAEALSGQAGGRGVRALLRSPTHREALRSMLQPGVALERCRLRRVKFKPGRKLSAYYDVAFGGPRRGTRAVAVTWTPVTNQSGDDHWDAAATLEAEARERGLVEPFRQLGVAVPAAGVRLQITPLDPAFAHLVRLADPAYVRTLLSRALEDAAPRSTAPTVRTIRFRPGQRHVLRYEIVGRAGRTVFAKLERPGRPGHAGTTAAAVAEVLALSGRGLGAAAPAACVGEDGVVLYDLVPGRTLTEVVGRDEAAGVAGLSQAGDLLRLLHTETTVVDTLAPTDHHGEIAATRRACEHITSLLPHVGVTVAGVLAKAGELLERTAPEPATFAHGDYKSDHLLVGAGTMTLIDFDSCVRAEPALDLGKFLADLRYWFFAWSNPALAGAQQRFLEGYWAARTEEKSLRMVRARAYESLLLVKLAARRIRVDDVDWATRTSMLVTEADRLVKAAARVQ